MIDESIDFALDFSPVIIHELKSEVIEEVPPERFDFKHASYVLSVKIRRHEAECILPSSTLVKLLHHHPLFSRSVTEVFETELFDNQFFGDFFAVVFFSPNSVL